MNNINDKTKRRLIVARVKSILVCKFLGIIFMTNVQTLELFMPRKLLDSEEAAW